MASVDEKYRMNMCEGPLFSKIVRFAVPLYFSLLLQLMFNAVDLMVIGRFAEHQAMAAIGATLSPIHLVINIVIGLAVGTNVLAANAYGTRNEAMLSQTVHTSMFVAVVGGALLGGFGYSIARPLLILMDSPADVLDKSVLYMQIYFIGLPALQVYNFGSSVLRGVGDTRRPLLYLAISGFVNIPLNLLFVLCFGMDVDGVAWATTLSQILSAILVWRAMKTASDGLQLRVRKLRIHWPIMKKMMSIGIPSAVQASCFSLSNILIQSSINSFGSLVMAGNSAVISIEGIIYMGPYALHQTVISFVGQNAAAKLSVRVKQSIWYCFWLSFVIAAVTGPLACFFGNELIGIYTTDRDVIAWGMQRMLVLMMPYASAGAMDIVSGAMRGIGKSMLSACIVLVGVCLFRIVWIFTVFRASPTYETLLLSYPISWTATSIVNGIVLWFVCSRLFRKWRSEKQALLEGGV